MNRHFLRTNVRGAMRHAAVVTAMGLLGSPLASHANPSEQAINACVQAFVAANLPKEQRVVVDKQSIAREPLDQRSRTYRISLAATGATSGRQIAKGTCIADRNGEIIRLNGRRPTQLSQTASASKDINAAR
jgi:hypothetical protein